MANPFVLNPFGKYGYGDRMRGVMADHAVGIDPYSTGYHYIFFTKLPSALDGEAGKFLTAICQSVTIPDITVESLERNGINGFIASTPGAAKYDSQEITLKLNEYQNLPVLQIIGKWVSIFRNTIYGVADPEIGSINQVDFMGKCIYATTAGDGKTVQYAASFSGIYPGKIPTGAFSSDRAEQSLVDHEIPFRFQFMYTGEQVISTAQSLVSSTYASSVQFVDSMYSEASS